MSARFRPSNEPRPRFRLIDPVAVVSLQRAVGVGQAVLKHVGHGDQLHWRRFHRQGIPRRAAPAAAAADQDDANGVVLRGMDARNDGAS